MDTFPFKISIIDRLSENHFSEQNPTTWPPSPRHRPTSNDVIHFLEQNQVPFVSDFVTMPPPLWLEDGKNCRISLWECVHFFGAGFVFFYLSTCFSDVEGICIKTRCVETVVALVFTPGVFGWFFLLYPLSPSWADVPSWAATWTACNYKTSRSCDGDTEVSRVVRQIPEGSRDQKLAPCSHVWKKNMKRGTRPGILF